MLDVSGPFAGKSGAVADNLVLKALSALRQRVIGLKGGRFLLEKNVPVAGWSGRRLRRCRCGPSAYRPCQRYCFG